MKLSFHHTHPALNVKAHGLTFPDGGTDKQRNEAEESAREEWWHSAGILAQQHGYTDVESAGRMGGWLMPYTEGYKGRREYPDFPNPERVKRDDWEPDEEAAFVRFEKFAEAIEELRLRYPDLFAEELAYVLERDAEQAAEEAAASAKAQAIAAATAQCVAALRDVPSHHRTYDSKLALAALDEAEAMP